MRLTTILLTAAFIHVYAAGVAQRISLSGKNLPLKQVFTAIKKQTGYVVFSNEEILSGARPVTLMADHMPLQELLDRVLEDQLLDYIIQGKTIILTRKTLPVSPQVQPFFEAALTAISGQVLAADGRPIPGASVRVVGGKTGSTTNDQGYFSITGIANNSIIEISSVGFIPLSLRLSGDIFQVAFSSPAVLSDEKPVNKRRVSSDNTSKLLNANPGYLVIQLAASTSPLDEVQVIAYGTITRRLGIGSVSTVSSKEIQDQPVMNLFQALQGRVPGMVVSTISGAPGAMTVMQIRGQNNLASNPADFLHHIDQPLYIVDGVPLAVQNTALSGSGLSASNPSTFAGGGLMQFQNGLSPINGINPADIESISVLKDADATSIYGSQGSNGVVLITTKKGASGKDRVDVILSSGPTYASRTVPMMNTAQYLEMRHEAISNSGVTPNEFSDPDLLVFDQNKYTNWMKKFYGETARHTDAHASVSGGSESTSYLVSGGYTRDTYNYPGDFSENRYSLHTAFSHTSQNKRFKVDFGTDYSYDENNSSTGTINVFAGFTMAPNFPDLLDEKGNLLWGYKGVNFNNFQGNALAYMKQPASVGTRLLNTHLLLNYQLMPSLSISLNAGYNRMSEHAFSSVPIASQNPAVGAYGQSSFLDQNNDAINIEPQLNFTRYIGKGLLTALVGGTYKKNTMDQMQISAGPYYSDALLGSVAASGAPPMVVNQAAYYKYIAGFARINYVWDNKYIINFTGNRNGSSNFGPGKQFGDFGSAGVGWILTEEKGIKAALPFMSFAKVALNYGTSGSDAITPYQYQPNWGVAESAGITYQGVPGLTPVNPLNPTYAWSLNKKWNASLDLGFFKDRLLFNITAYRNRSIDQLVSYTEPIQTGFDYVVANAPYEVTNKGVEITLASKNMIHNNFRWTTDFNFSHNANILSRFPDIVNSPYANIYVVGKSIKTKFLLPYVNVDPQTGVYQFRNRKGEVSPNVSQGSAFNNVGGDETETVDLNPKFTGGLNNTFSYKGFTLSVFFQFVKQHGTNYLYSIYSNFNTLLAGQPMVNMPVVMLNRWQKSGDKAKFQRFSEGFYSTEDIQAYTSAVFFSSSTGAYSDASYIRLKNVALSYQLPSSVLKRMFLQGCTFYVNAQNLFLITGYELGDPETMNIFGIPPQRTVAAGVNFNF